MRIAVVFNSPARLADSSIRYERYLRGFRALGHEAFIVSRASSAEDFPWDVVTAEGPSAFTQPGFWGPLSLDAAFVVTWLGMADILAAIKASCPLVVSMTDSDGYVGARVHPGQLLLRMRSFHDHWLGRLRSAGWWLRQYLGAYRRVDAPMLESAAVADRIACCSAGARRNLAAFFAYHGRPDLGRKVVVSPYPVEESFVEGSVAEQREDQVVAIGRWHDLQKDAPLLRAGIELFIRRGGRSRFVLVGSGGERHFRGPVQDYPRQVRYVGVQPPAAVADLLRQSRVLVSASRWESGPIVANEALVLGCSLVGPRSIPSFAGYCADRRFGTAYPGRSPSALAAALLRETAAWGAGHRLPGEIAALWRPYFAPAEVCARLLGSADAARDDLPLAGLAQA